MFQPYTFIVDGCEKYAVVTLKKGATNTLVLYMAKMADFGCFWAKMV